MRDREVDEPGPAPDGDVSVGVKLAIAAATTITVLLFGSLLALVDRSFASSSVGLGDTLADDVRHGLVLWVFVALAAVAGLPRVSWWARSAIVLALVHVGMLVAAAVAWRSFEDAYDRPPLVDALPLHWIGAGLGLVVIAIALVGIGRRGVPRWFQGVAAGGVVTVLAVGAWLPVLSSWVAQGRPMSIDVDDATARAALPWAIGVPLALGVIAAGMVTLARPHDRRRPARDPERHGAWTALGVVYVIALLATPETFDARRVHGNLVHLLGGAIAFAWCALIALAIAHLRATRALGHDLRRPAPWVQRGVVIADGDAGPRAVVGQVRFLGWLAGFRVVSERFRLVTRDGELPVPAGASVRAPLPTASVLAGAGEACPILRAGDRVAVSGFVEPAGAGPFRGHGQPVAGSAGLVVVPDDSAPAARRDAVLALWRPCLLFVLASSLAALPLVALT